MGRITTSETRRRVYLLAIEWLSGSKISDAVGISKQAVSRHLLALVSDGLIRPIDPRSRPRIYRRTSKPFPDKSTPDHQGWSPVVRGHRTGRLFKLTSPPKRNWPWLWDNYWTESNVNFYIVRDLDLETPDGQIHIKSLRFIEGPRSSSITIWVDDDEILDGFQLLAHDDYATEVSILAVNEIARRTGLRIALPEVPQETEYGIPAPPGVVDVALEEDLRTETTHFDRSKGDGEVETTDRERHWKESASAPRLLGPDVLAERWAIAEHLLGRWLEWDSWVSRWSSYFGQEQEELPGRWHLLRGR